MLSEEIWINENQRAFVRGAGARKMNGNTKEWTPQFMKQHSHASEWKDQCLAIF